MLQNGGVNKSNGATTDLFWPSNFWAILAIFALSACCTTRQFLYGPRPNLAWIAEQEYHERLVRNHHWSSVNNIGRQKSTLFVKNQHRSRNTRTPEPWNPRIPEPQNPGTPEPQNPRTWEAHGLVSADKTSVASLQTRHLLCLQTRHLLCLQTRYLLCLTRHLNGIDNTGASPLCG